MIQPSHVRAHASIQQWPIFSQVIGTVKQADVQEEGNIKDYIDQWVIMNSKISNKWTDGDT